VLAHTADIQPQQLLLHQQQQSQCLALPNEVLQHGTAAPAISACRMATDYPEQRVMGMQV
jgi:hypothetical protein